MPTIAMHALHYFACIHQAWLNLPEEMADQFPTEEHLRAYALIKTGYCDSNTLVCSSKAEAQRTAAFLKPIDSFAVVTVKDNVVIRYSAQSQSMRAMNRDDFQRSKEAVLDIISAMTKTSRKELEASQPA